LKTIEQSNYFSYKITLAFILILLFWSTNKLWSQGQDGSKYQEEFQIKIKQAIEPIKIDGFIDELSWKNADVAKDFWQKFPKDNLKAIRQTEVRATYDEKFIYFAAICYDTSQYVIQTLKRDTRFFESDGFCVFLDPVNKRSNGFLFGVSPLNVQTEDLIAANTEDLTFSWDNKWFSATKNYPDHWTVEIAIPLKTLRYDSKNTNWGVNFLRNDMKNFHINAWTHVPVQFLGIDLGYTGALIWDKAPGKQSLNASIIPYVSGSAVSNNEANEPTSTNLKGGLDAKISLTPALNLDLTINPNFSQIEVDQQVTNLTRFKLFFPERRTFFLENDDIFSSYGAPPYRPFYSRTIGLDKNGQVIPIIGGIRLSGNLNKKLRIGIMNMQTQEIDTALASIKKTAVNPAQNFTALTFNQRIWSRSSIKGYVLNKQSFMSDAEKKHNPLEHYGRNAGVELLLSDLSGKYILWGGHHLSMKPSLKDKNSFSQLSFNYAGKSLSFFLDMTNFEKNYYADMGFISRLESYAIKGKEYSDGDTTIRAGFKQVYNSIDYNFRPDKSKINSHLFGFETYFATNPDGKIGEYNNRIRYFLNFRNTSSLKFRIDPQLIRLVNYTPLPTNKPLAPGSYNFIQYNIQYNSDARKKFAFSTNYLVGGFYNGSIQQYKFGVVFRQQPWGNFSINFEENKLKFPADYGNVILKLISPKTEINFSNKMFWTTFVQYNTQRNNLNINSRFQWRYSPMSDLFLVYTDNYFVDPNLKSRSRALVFKLNYWLSI
jgi:Domain of unknown function (DUF5916)/Carbohydrate family 9 binding domain-like